MIDQKPIFPESPYSPKPRRKSLPRIVVMIIVIDLFATLVIGGGIFLAWKMGWLDDTNGARLAAKTTLAPTAVPTATFFPSPTFVPTALSISSAGPTPEVTPVSDMFENPLIPYEAVVKIEVMIASGDGEAQGWWGSGTIISPDGMILTNAHVVSSTRDYTVTSLVVAVNSAADLPPEPRYHARILQIDRTLDVAVLRISEDLDGNIMSPAVLNLPFVPLGDSDQLMLGDPLVILGYPEIGGETITLTRGEVSGFTPLDPSQISADGDAGRRAFIKTSAVVTGGTSGGLVADQDGELVGIATRMGNGSDEEYADCRRLADTNGDGVIDENDSCIPTGGFINSLRPVNLFKPYIQAAQRGEVNFTPLLREERIYVPSGEALYSDDFSDPASGWLQEESEERAFYYQDGKYHIDVNAPHTSALVGLGQIYYDSIITVDARLDAHTGDSGYGVICRRQDDQNYYGFEVSADGYFSIWKRQEGRYTYLAYWQYSKLIEDATTMAGEGGTLHLTAACVSDRLTLAVANRVLVELQDAAFRYGDVGLFVNTYANQQVSAVFDNFSVYEP